MDQQLHTQEEEAQTYGLAAISACLQRLDYDEDYETAQTVLLDHTKRVKDGTYYVAGFTGLFKVLVNNGTWTATPLETVDDIMGFQDAFDYVDEQLREALTQTEQKKLF